MIPLSVVALPVPTFACTKLTPKLYLGYLWRHRRSRLCGVQTLWSYTSHVRRQGSNVSVVFFFTPRVYLKSATNRQSWHFHVSNINTWLTLYRVITAFVALRSLGRYRANLWMCLLYYYRYGYLPDGSWQFRPSSSGSNVLVGTESYFWVKTLRNMSYGVITFK